MLYQVSFYGHKVSVVTKGMPIPSLYPPVYCDYLCSWFPKNRQETSTTDFYQISLHNFAYKSASELTKKQTMTQSSQMCGQIKIFSLHLCFSTSLLILHKVTCMFVELSF